MREKRCRHWPVWVWRVMVAPMTMALTAGAAWLGAWLPDRSWRPQGNPDGVPVIAGWSGEPFGLPASGEGLLVESPSSGTAAPGDPEVPVPNGAIRLRIIANSDRPGDQAVKGQVRDRVVQLISRALQGVTTPDEARARLRALVPRVQREAQAVVRGAGYDYPVRTDYGMVPFPTKIYGDQVYPAGRYEALRIVLGRGLGQNWWCVLFPPLCFVDLTNGDAVPTFHEKGNVTTVELPGMDGRNQPVIVRWLILDLFMKVVEWFRHLW